MELSVLELRALKDLARREKRYILEVQKALLDSLNAMRAGMTVIYEKYSTKGVLTLVEMTKYNKYATMEKQILGLLTPAIKANLKTMQRLLPAQYNQAFFDYAWAVDNSSGVRLSWGVVNTKAILATLSITNPKNILLLNALKNYDGTAKMAIRSALLNGLAQGKSYERMARDLKKALNKTYKKALTIIRTEGQWAQNMGQNDVYLRAMENGVEGNKIWDATLDGLTRTTHRKMDGAVKLVQGWKLTSGSTTLGPGGYAADYPGDPNLPAGERIHCRCRLRFQVEGYSPLLRRTREQGVIPYQTYDVWKNEYHPDWK